MGTTTTITIRRVETDTELHRHYDGQYEQQPCSINLDLEDGELWCDYNANIGGGYSMSVFHRRTLSLSIPCLTGEAANDLMEEVAPIAQRVLDGASIEWDGNNNVGVLNESAQAAYDEFETVVRQWAEDPGTPTVSTVDADDWYSGHDPSEELGLTADTTDDELEAMEPIAEADIKQFAEGVVVVRGLDRFLSGLRDQKRQEVREELESVAEQIDAMRDRRTALIKRVKAFGDPDRAIAALADLSHTQVQNIVKG